MNTEKEKEQKLPKHKQKQQEHDIVVQIKNKALLGHVITTVLNEAPLSKPQQVQDSYLSSSINTGENKNNNNKNKNTNNR